MYITPVWIYKEWYALWLYFYLNESHGCSAMPLGYSY